jgi:hypothetical protein
MALDDTRHTSNFAARQLSPIEQSVELIRKADERF